MIKELMTNNILECPPLIGVSNNISRIRELIDHVANTGLSVVITGESGVGKEVVAHQLYHKSSRCGKPFIKINCAALPEGLLESELFGYEVGAFTGADRNKRGKFELAHGGVLFLDEIGDMSLQLQAKLLHVLQGGEFSRLGSENDIKTDTWIIASTNHDLEKDLKTQNFREDLYYRLNIIKICIDPLRNRREDIPHLIEYYINQYESKYSRDNRPSSFSPNVIERLKNYHWPGNVRELKNVLQRIMVLGFSKDVLAELFPPDLFVQPKAFGGYPSNITSQPYSLPELDINSLDLSSTSLKDIKKKFLAQIEREVITSVLSEAGWNRSRATKILKISYKTLLNKIKELDIQFPTDPY